MKILSNFMVKSQKMWERDQNKDHFIISEDLYFHQSFGIYPIDYMGVWGLIFTMVVVTFG